MVNLVPEVWQDPADPTRIKVMIFDRDVPSPVPLLVLRLDEARELRNVLHQMVGAYAPQFFGNNPARKTDIDNFKRVPDV